MHSASGRRPITLLLSVVGLALSPATAVAQITGITDSRIQAFFKSQATPPAGACPTGYGLASGPGCGPTCRADMPPGNADWSSPTWVPPVLVPPGAADSTGDALGGDWMPFTSSPMVFLPVDSGISGTSQASASIAVQAMYWIDPTNPNGNTSFQTFTGSPLFVEQDPGSFGAAFLVVNWSVDYSIGSAGLDATIRAPGAMVTGTIGGGGFAEGRWRREYWRVDSGVPTLKLGEEALSLCIDTPGTFAAAIPPGGPVPQLIPFADQSGPFTLRVVGSLECQVDPATMEISFPDEASGDRSGCPCNNPPAGGGLGCNNFGAGPAQSATLDAMGVASLSNDTITLLATGENNTSTTVFWTGTAIDTTPPIGVPHGAGLRCVTAGLKRLYVHSASGGAVSAGFGVGADLTVSARTAAVGAPISSGQTRHYFNIYRDPAASGPCGNSSSTVNLTNAGSITWAP